MPTEIQPLDQNFKIVNPDGTPTEFFIRWAQQRQTDIQDAVPSTRQINTGTGLAGGGDLSADLTLTLDADLDDLNDVDTVSTPPTDGQALIWDAGSSEWIPGTITSGSGGIFGPGIVASNGTLTSAFATHGMVFTPLSPVTITGFLVLLTQSAGQTYRAFVASMTSKTLDSAGDTLTGGVINTELASKTLTVPTTSNQWVVVQLDTPVALTANADYTIGIQRTDSTGTAIASVNWHSSQPGSYGFPCHLYRRLYNLNTSGSLNGLTLTSIDAGSATALAIWPFGSSSSVAGGGLTVRDAGTDIVTTSTVNLLAPLSATANLGVADLSLDNTAVTPGSYGNATNVAQFTVDQQGRLTSASNVAITFPADAVTSVFARIGAVVAVGGDYTASQITNVPAGSIAAVTVQAAIDELDAEKQPLSSNLTAYAGGDTPSAFTLGIVDSVDAATWRTAIGAGTSSTTGTVTSVDGSGGTTGLTLTGGPIVASGTLTLGGTLAVANGGTGAATAAGARTNLGLDAGGAGDIWVEKAGDTMTGSLIVNASLLQVSSVQGQLAVGSIGHVPEASLAIRATGRQIATWASGDAAMFSTYGFSTVSDTSGSASATNRIMNSFGGATLSTPSVAITVTNGIGLYVSGPPTAGTNVTITNSYGFVVDNGLTRLDGFTSIGTSGAPTSVLHIGGTQSSVSWTTQGLNFAVVANTLTDTSSAAAATVASRAVNSFGTSTLASTNAITVTDAATVYISNRPTAGANTTITTGWALWLDAGNARFDGTLNMGGAVQPQANDGAALGVSGTAWADLFLASGGVINWNAGNATLTHSAGLLTSNVDINAPRFVSTNVVRLKGYTVATLPAGTQGDTAFCTDLLAPTFLAAVVGGGAVVGPVFYNGTAWVSY